MSTSHLTIFTGKATDKGAFRDNNEDALTVAGTLAVVADGMGGHEAGEVASRLAARTLAYSSLFTQPGGMTKEQNEQALADMIAEREAEAQESQANFRSRRRKNTTALNKQIMKTLERLRGIIGEADESIKSTLNQRAGTTLTGAWLTYIGDQNMWFVFNVGDSRTYRLVRGEDLQTNEESLSLSGELDGVGLEQITVDHSEVQYLVDTGQITAMEALTHPRRNVITRALGTGNYWEPDFWVIPAKPGDRLMLCSDGLSGELSHNYMARVLATVEHPQDAADVLQTAALRAGGRDNISVVVVDAITEEEADARAQALKELTATESHEILEKAEDYEVKPTASSEDPEFVSERSLNQEFYYKDEQ
ncbi:MULTISPECIES: PP2C family serine/threonine-protein phosphatase [unclassified Rothia (in: high G+C Gram-positive bacteria)]|uniref:PP2C family protein-serine/threonine phosphatase n=1 Tax=unclassified Rothia (in: high G+C Gram-positive bacteria) TaxID=2689056 RepID=UPI00195A534D|nr:MULTISPECIES: protein phosphatase 2C domain-containing protein [unclassified Rothia (in: high G+C Gram-positive bacteria)]MBM7051360.1 serine/threonine-protein phosphatase [Rothia sp. ZJ1223]QRZ61154.1 serine/threonine-protein phosphatase [Rothia sp. ZJ932]